MGAASGVEHRQMNLAAASSALCFGSLLFLGCVIGSCKIDMLAGTGQTGQTGQ